MFTKCSLSGTSQLSFCDTPLLFRPHLGHQATRTGCPCGFLRHWGYSTGVSRRKFSAATGFLYRRTLQHREGATPATNSQRAQYASFTRRSCESATSCQWIQLSGYNKRPRIFRYGVFFKNKPAMTYSPTPTKVQYHRREES